MKQLFSTLLASVAVASGAAAMQPVATTGNSATTEMTRHLSDGYGKIRSMSRTMPAPPRSETDIEIPFAIKSAQRFTLAFAGALTHDAGGRAVCYKPEDGSGKFLMPEGRYDFLFFGHGEDRMGMYMFFLEDHDVKDGSEISLSTADALRRVDIKYIAADGSVMKFPELFTEPNEGDNAFSGDIFTRIVWDDAPVYSLGDGILWDSDSYICSNIVPERFEVTRLASILWTQGVANMVIPIDFSKPEATTSATGWKQCETRFAPTPLNLKKSDLLTPDDWAYSAYSMSSASMYKGNFYGMISTNGVRNYSLPGTGVLQFWVPEGYDGTWSQLVYPTGQTLFQGNSSSYATIPAIIAMPVCLNDGEFEQVGVNTAFFNQMNWKREGADVSGNPRFNGKLPEAVLANCAPTLITQCLPPAFDMTFIGRHGENIGINVCPVPFNETGWPQQTIDAFGGQATTADIRVNGETMCDDLSFIWGMFTPGQFEGTVECTNILVDGAISGKTTATFAYDSEKGNGCAPTVTVLSVRDADDTINDHLAGPAGASVELYAMAQILKLEERGDSKWNYYETGALSEVKVEYSPMGMDDWQSLPVEEIPELFYMPGFGHCYSVALDGVDRPSDTKWYDLRVRLTDEYDAWQQQVISPAFRVENLESSIRDIEAEVACGGSDAMWTIDGRLVDSRDPAPGLYVVRENGHVTKRLIGR